MSRELVNKDRTIPVPGQYLKYDLLKDTYQFSPEELVKVNHRDNRANVDLATMDYAEYLTRQAVDNETQNDADINACNRQIVHGRRAQESIIYRSRMTSRTQYKHFAEELDDHDKRVWWEEQTYLAPQT